MAKAKTPKPAAENAAAANLDDAVFENGGKKYKVLMPRVYIPGIGERTALELANDKKGQDYVIKENAIGSVIKEIVTAGEAE
jgi:hypothetical protein